MAELDSLQIRITASANQATSALDKLCGSLMLVGDTVIPAANGVNTMADALDRLVSHNGSLVETSNALKNIAKTSISLSAISATGNPFTGIIDGLTSLASVHPSDSLQNLEYIKNTVSKIGGDMGAAAGASLGQIANGLKAFEGVNIPEYGEKLPNLAKGLRSVGSSDVARAAQSLGPVAAGLRQLNEIKITADVEKISQLAYAVSRFGLATIPKATANIPPLATALRDLIATLAGAPAVSNNTIRMVEALSKLNVHSANSATGMNRLSTGLRRYTGHAKKARSATKGLASAIGKIYATYWLLFRAFSKIGKSINLASQLKEIQNVVDVTFGDMNDKMNEFAKNAVDTLGMSELTAKQVGSKFQAMGSNMGISKNMVKSTNDFVQKATQGYADVANSMADVSINLTRLAGDMASFYNQDYEEVAEKLQAVFTGQTRPLRAYGLDLTQATLKEWALKNGLDADIKSMTQAEKTLLRYQYVLANTTAAHGDFERTISTWANQIRIAKERLKQLGIVLGQIAIYTFKPLVQSFNKAMKRIIELATATLNSLGKIFGWQIEWTDGGVLRDEEEAAGDIADDMGDAADNAKKFKNFLLGIDELNLLPGDDDKDKGGKGLGDIGGGLGDLEGGIKIKPIEKGFESVYDTLYKLGKRIAEVMKDFLKNIDWDAVYKKARRFGKGLAQFLNGYLSDAEFFYEKGRFIANGINTIANAIDAFFHEFNGWQLGVDIGSYINGFTKNLDWGVIRSAAYEIAHDIAQTINGAFVTIDWKMVGSTIANGLNTVVDFFYTLGDEINWAVVGRSIADGLNGVFYNFDFAKLGQGLSKWAKGLLDAIIAFLDRVEWDIVGENIGEFIASVDFTNIIGKLGVALWKAINGAFKAYASMFNAAPIQTAILSFLASRKFRSFITGKITGLLAVVGKDVGKLFSGELASTFVGGILSTPMGTGTFTNIVSGFNAVSASLSTATKALGSFAVGFIEFATIEKSISGIVRGTDDVAKSITKIVGATALAGTALTALLGFPAGLIATLAVGTAAGITGLIDGIVDNQLAAFNEGVINALTVPDGANLYDYMHNLTENVMFAADGFNSLAKKSDSITDMKEKIGKDMDEIDESIQKMDLSLKAQIELLPEDIDTIIGLFNGLNDDLRDVMSESYDLIVAGIGGWDDEMVSSFEASKPEILKAVHGVNEGLLEELDSLDQQIAELNEKHKEGLSDDEFYKQLMELVGRQNEIRASFGLIKDSVSDLQAATDGVDLSSLFMVDSNGFLQLSDQFIAADEALRVAFDDTTQTIETGGNGVIEALKSYRDNAEDLDMKNTFATAITIEETQVETEKEKAIALVSGFYGDVYKGLISGVDGVIESAKNDYRTNPASWLLYSDESDAVNWAVQKYQRETIEPYVAQIKEKWGDVIDTTYMDDLSKRLIESLFVDTGESKQLKTDYENILNEALTGLPAIADKSGKETSKALQNGLKTKDVISELDKVGPVIGQHDRALDGSKKSWIDFGKATGGASENLLKIEYAMAHVNTITTATKSGIVDFSDAFSKMADSGKGIEQVSTGMKSMNEGVRQFSSQLPSTQSNFKMLSTSMQTDVLGIDVTFKKMYTDTMVNGNKTIAWFKGSFIPLFSTAYWQNILSGIPIAFQNAFTMAFNNVKQMWGQFTQWANENMKLDVTAQKKGNAGTEVKMQFPAYEKGGFPEDGMFFANHTEMVGQFANGRTAVANNEQIVEGIKQGVFEAVSSAMTNLQVQNNIELKGDAADFFTAMVNENNRAIMRTGASPIRV